MMAIDNGDGDDNYDGDDSDGDEIVMVLTLEIQAMR